MSSTLKTLVVDDQESMRIFMTRVLDSLGYENDTAENGQECLDKCKQSSYDVVFLDLVMPILGGESCLKELKLLRPETDVVIISVNDDEDGVSDLLHAGATAYLCKPFNQEQVSDLMQKMALRREEIGKSD